MPKVLALIAAIAVSALVWAGVATATGSAPWSSERLTYEVKKLKRQNAAQAAKIRSLRGDITNLYYDVGFVQLQLACATEPNPHERDEVCAQLEAYADNYPR